MSKSGTPTVVFLGPAHPYRGGIATFSNRLAHEFNQQHWHSIVYTFSLQYPGFLFPGKTQYATEPEGYGLEIHQAVNSMNPFNWIKVGNELNRFAPDLIMVRYWLPFMAPAFGTILRLAKRNGKTKVICIADNIIPHEKRVGDSLLTNYFQKAVDGFVAMSAQVMQDLKKLHIHQPSTLLHHPLFDHFGTKIDQNEAKAQLNLPPDHQVVLFFGFIRHYKGLDLLIKALADDCLKAHKLTLVIAGECYEDPSIYTSLINELGLQSAVVWLNEFIPDEKVAVLMSAADVLVQPYRHATQSGVTPLAMHFDLPMVVTQAGGLREQVKDGETGLVVPISSKGIAQGINKYFAKGKSSFVEAIQKQKQQYSWSAMYEGLLTFYKQLTNVK